MGNNFFLMYRIFILSLLAIVFATFAIEPSQIILRATEIRGDAMVLEWSPIEWSKTYKVFYDEQSLINPKAPEPILESPATDKTRLEITKMLEGAEYYFIVRWYDDQDVEMGETLPLHASTLNLPIFALHEAKVIDDQHVELSFSRPVDITKTQIEIMNTATKNVRGLESITVSDQDLRIVNIVLKGKLEPWVSHDVVLKKVTNTSGETLPLESSKKTTLTFSLPETPQEDPVAPAEDGVMPVTEESPAVVESTPAEPAVVVPEDVSEEDVAVTPDVALADLKKEAEAIAAPVSDTSTEDIALLPLEDTKEPVPIDKLPQTGAPAFLFLLMALALWAVLSYKKKISL